MNGCDNWGPDSRLDTQVDQFDWCHISMSYASFVIIWHFMSYDAYDIKIWHASILSILESKETSEPQQSHLLIQFWLTNCLKRKKLKSGSEIFFLYKFWESFVFLGPKRWSWRQHFPESLRLEIYVFGNLMVQRMGSGGFLIQIWKSIYYAPPYCPEITKNQKSLKEILLMFIVMFQICTSLNEVNATFLLYPAWYHVEYFATGYS